jgi:hypothetical protein
VRPAARPPYPCLYPRDLGVKCDFPEMRAGAQILMRQPGSPSAFSLRLYSS